MKGGNAMIKRIYARIRKIWDKRQEEAIVEEYELLKEVWHEECSPEPIYVPVQKVQTPKMSWAEFKANNEMVNQMFNRTRAA